jgi:fructoselysine and glucoselysine-specific PTS system IIB component
MYQKKIFKGDYMVILLRVDHRLLHGQIAFSWTQHLKADCILIANDSAAMDELKKTTMKLAKPQGVKLVIKTIDASIQSLNEGATDKYKLFIVTESVSDAKKLADAYAGIKQVNVGGTIAREGTRNVAKAVYLYQEEIDMLSELTKKGIEVECRILPMDHKVLIKG